MNIQTALELALPNKNGHSGAGELIDYLSKTPPDQDCPLFHNMTGLLLRAIKNQDINAQDCADLFDHILTHRPQWADSALPMAVFYTQLPVCKVLMKHGADPLKIFSHQNALNVAADRIDIHMQPQERADHEAIIDLILQSRNIGELHLSNALFKAVDHANMTATRKFLEYGAPLDRMKTMGGNGAYISILTYATQRPGTSDDEKVNKAEKAIVSALLEHPDIGSILNLGWTLGQEAPLHAAARRGNDETLSLFLSIQEPW